MGTITELESVRRRRMLARFCTACRSYRSLIGVREEGRYVIRCKKCGHVRATIPSQERLERPDRPERPEPHPWLVPTPSAHRRRS